MPHFRPHHPSARRPWPALALLLATVACAGKAPAETAAPVEAKPAAPTTSAADDELQARLDWLAERLEKARVDNHIPGMAVAVVKDDQMVFARGFGLADLETGREVTPQTVFAIGSSTKAFSATLAAMQVDAGKLSWDDTVVTHLPEMKLQPRPGKAEGGDADPTLRDMGSHRSGFTRMSMLWIANALPRDQMLAKASGAEPIAGFRDEFHYNNVTYTAVGEAAARTADTTWSAMLQERIFEPLGMGDTTATAAGAIDDPARAQGYRWREVSERHEALPMRNLDAIGPAGSINSTVVDMSQWLRLQLGRGTFEGKELVSKGAIEETWTPQMEMGGGLSYGLGWMLGSWQGHRVVEHGGNIDGYATEVGMLPDDGIGFVLLTNISATPLQRGSLELVFDSLLGELPGKADAKDGAAALDLAPYSGRYVANFGPFDDMRFTVTAESGTLHLDVPGQQKYELAHPDADGRWAFALTDAIKVYFDLDEQGKRANVLHMLQGGLDFELPREGYSFPPEVDAAEVADLLGRYESENGKVKSEVELVEGRLAIDIEGQMKFILRKPGEDGRWHFRAKDDLAISFRRSAKGAVDAVMLHEGKDDVPLLRKGGKVAPLPTVQALLAKGKATAAEKRLAKLGAIELTGTVRMPSSAVEGRFRIVMDAERHGRLELDLGIHGKFVDTYDGTDAWSVATVAPPTQAEGKYLAQAKLGGPLALGDWTRGFDDATVVGRTTRDGRELVDVVLRAKDLPPRHMFVDPKTGEVVEVDVTSLAEGVGAIPSKGTLGDYRRVLGLRIPHRLSQFNVHSGDTIFEVESVKKVDGDPAELFARPTL